MGTFRWASILRSRQQQPSCLRIANHDIAINLRREQYDGGHEAFNVCVRSVPDVRVLTLGILAFIPLPEDQEYFGQPC